MKTISQFSLRTLFVLATACAIACGWIAYERAKSVERRSAYDWLVKQHHVTILMEEPTSRRGKWLSQLLGDNKYTGEVSAFTNKENFTDEFLVRLGKLPNVREVFLGPKATDRSVSLACRLPKLRVLYLDNPQLTDDGMRFIGSVRGLTELHLRGRSVTDDGIRHLKGMRLRLLAVPSSSITDRALDVIASLKDLEYLNIASTDVTDGGLIKLAALPSLKKIVVSSCPHLTSAGLDELRKQSPHLEIDDRFGRPGEEAVPLEDEFEEDDQQ